MFRLGFSCIQDYKKLVYVSRTEVPLDWLIKWVKTSMKM